MVGLRQTPKRLLSRALLIALPSVYWAIKLKKLERTQHEAEMLLLPVLCDPRRVSVDIGAGSRLYAIKLARLSSSCIAFEVRPSAASELKAIASWFALPIRVEAVALSSSTGEAHLRVMVHDVGRSTIENANSLTDEDGSFVVEMVVPARRLDDFGLTNVGFIKIDVEGHELAVLKGAMSILRSQRPALLIEAENRHRPNAVEDLDAFLTGLGYAGFFVDSNQVLSMDRFAAQTHQNPANVGGWKSNWKRTGVYINNFVYIHDDLASEFATKAMAALCAARDGNPRENSAHANG